MPRKEDPKDTLDTFCAALGFEPEFRFAPDRKFRADWRKGNVLVEFEGGIFAGDGAGHRQTGKFLRDLEKYNLAAILGYRVIRLTPPNIRNGEAFTWIEQALEEIA